MNNDEPGYSDEFAKRLAELLAAKQGTPVPATVPQPEVDRPSLAPAILFGFAGATYSSVKASKLGLPVARYWVAATVSCVVAVLLLMALGVGLLVASSSDQSSQASSTSVPYVASEPATPYVAPTPAYVPLSGSVSSQNQQKLQYAWDKVSSNHANECADPSVFAYRLWSASEGQHAGVDGNDIPLSDYTQLFETACARWSVGS